MTHEQRALMLRKDHPGRWVIEYYDGESEEWKMTIWRGIDLEVLLPEAKRLQDSRMIYGLGASESVNGENLKASEFRLRNVDTDDEILGAIL